MSNVDEKIKIQQIYEKWKNYRIVLKHVLHKIQMTVSSKLMIIKCFVNDNVTTAALAVYQ